MSAVRAARLPATRSAILVATLFAAVGCAAQGAPVRPLPAPASAAAPARPAPRAAAPVVLDSLPSREALAVLATLPEPLGADEGTAPVVTAPVTPPVIPPDARGDSAAIPVPAPTPTLGRSPAAPPSAPPPAGVSEPAAGDTCWRVQIAAPLERDKGDAMRAAAESQLITPMMVVAEAGRFKVRSRDCYARAAASALRERALASGFAGVFLVAQVKAGAR